MVSTVSVMESSLMEHELRPAEVQEDYKKKLLSFYESEWKGDEEEGEEGSPRREAARLVSCSPFRGYYKREALSRTHASEINGST